MTLFSETHRVLSSLGIHPRKKWGQHFLVNEAVLHKMVQIGQVHRGDRVLEIGPGLGFLTAHLLEAGAEVWGVEIDRKLAAWLGENIQSPSFHLLVGDVLDCDLPKLLGGGPIKVIANLPYNISTPVIFKLLEDGHIFPYIVLTLQEEVAQRLTSHPSKKSYGALSIMAQTMADIRTEFKVSSQCFYPHPEIGSRVVTLKSRSDPLVPLEETAELRRWIVRLFSQRRKSLRNSLHHAVSGLAALEILEEAGIDPGRRAETLGSSEIASLHRLIQARHARTSGS